MMMDFRGNKKIMPNLKREYFPTDGAAAAEKKACTAFFEGMIYKPFNCFFLLYN
jgi:hypothetical protein